MRRSLDALLAEAPTGADLAQDPLSLPKQYDGESDIEVAAILAACIAFGRVQAFLPVARRILHLANQHGGPARWAMDFGDNAASLTTVQYRWVRGQDFALLIATLGAALRQHGRIGSLFESTDSINLPHIGPLLEHGIGHLHHLAQQEATRLDLPPNAAYRRGFASLLSRPSGGSACKRMCMLLRWMSRSPGSGPTGVDLGLWNIAPSLLLIPLDTHVLRLSQMLRLTYRPQSDWRTVLEISAMLRKIDPDDPIRHDFALAHLGISGRCHHQFKPDLCTPCALKSVCVHGGCARNQKLQR